MLLNSDTNIVFLHNKEIDKTKWNQLIETAHGGSFCAQSWFLDIVCPNWQAIIINDYQIVLPITAKVKWGISYLFQPVFAQQLGVFSSSPLAETQYQQVVQYASSKFQYIDIFVNESNHFDSQKNKKWKIKNRHTQRLHLNKNYDIIHSQYDTKLRRNLKIANKHHLSVVSATIDELIDMFKTYQGNQINSLAEQDYEKLYTLLSYMHDKKMAHIIGVRDEQNELCATACFVIEKERVTYFKGSSTMKGRENRAMHFLLDNYIQQNVNKDIYLDFGGSNIESIARFYKSFGAHDYVYLHLQINRLPWPIRLIKR